LLTERNLLLGVLGLLPALIEGSEFSGLPGCCFSLLSRGSWRGPSHGRREEENQETRQYMPHWPT
jgi:hypothetical protein